MSTLGNRIKFFRKRAKISQFELEGKIGASAGSLSRIESGEVNPTKETLEKIVFALNLNSREENYLSGSAQSPVSDNIIKHVSESLGDYGKQRGRLFYVVDERWRIVFVSNSFLKVVQVNTLENFYKVHYKKTIPEILIDNNLGIRKLFDQDRYPDVLRVQLRQYYYEIGFMADDEYFFSAVKVIENDKTASKIWKEVLRDAKDQKNNNFLSQADSVVYFNLMGFKLGLRYSRQPLFDYPNFEIIEYHIENPILKRLYSMFNL